MTEFDFANGPFGKLKVMKVLRGEVLTRDTVFRLLDEYLVLRPEDLFASFTAGKPGDLLAEVLHLSEIFSTRFIPFEPNRLRERRMMLTVRSPRSSIDLLLTAEFFAFERLALFADISYDWVSGFCGMSAATYEMYSTRINSKKSDRESITYELSRRMPADLAVGVLNGSECSFLLVGSSSVIVDAAAAKILRLPLRSVPVLKRWSDVSVFSDDLGLTLMPDDFRLKPVSFLRRASFRCLSIVLHGVSLCRTFFDLVKRSLNNLYRVPSFVRKHILKKA